MVVAGQGWVRSGQADPVSVHMGDAIFWEVDEGHEVWSGTGMIGILVEYNFGGPVEHIEVRGKRWRVYLATGSSLERRAFDQLERVLTLHELTKWIFTHQVQIATHAVPHSHPILTLNTRYTDRDDLALATLLHEQLHWFLDEHWQAAGQAIKELEQLYPEVPVGFPEGAVNTYSTRLHLLINFLEYDAVKQILGESAADKLMQCRCVDHYTWVYKTVLKDTDRIQRVIGRHALTI